MKKALVVAIVSGSIIVSSALLCSYSVSKMFQPVQNPQFIYDYNLHEKSYSLLFSALKHSGSAVQELSQLSESMEESHLQEASSQLEMAILNIEEYNQLNNGKNSAQIEDVLSQLEHSREFLSSYEARECLTLKRYERFQYEMEAINCALQNFAEPLTFEISQMVETASKEKILYSNIIGYSIISAAASFGMLASAMNMLSREAEKNKRASLRK
ncbi:MAG: hypothetical protein QXW00_01565 [Candidatus Woesearchaeota archaeon]